MTQEQQHPITPLDDLAQPWLSDNYTVREIRAAGAMAVSPSEAEQAFATPWSSSTTNSSPITPPPELLREWCRSSREHEDLEQFWRYIATQAAQWGADQQLEALLVWLRVKGFDNLASDLLAACRPKPPSLKEQALEQLDEISTCFRVTHMGDIVCDKIRRALEALND